MDDIVRQAITKWPNVPDCYGWLGLDARGGWYMRDDRTQALGPFSGAGGSAASKGSRLQHEKLIDFIQRNYECDARGCWFFQNGPQRVYVELEAAPFIWRVHADLSVVAHTGQPAQATACVLDEEGRVYLDTSLGFGLVHTLDTGWVADAVERGVWTPAEMAAANMPARFKYVMSPQLLSKK